MICRKPFQGRFKCGRCIPCRVDRRNILTTRLLLESLSFEFSAFVTLTYSDAHLPLGGSLCRYDYTNFVKRLRHSASFKIFGVGEYGSVSERPHYHALIFGFRSCFFQRSQYIAGAIESCCPQCDLVRDTWGKGRVLLDQVNETTAHYVTKYTTKGHYWKKDPLVKEWLNGREPEFSAFPKRPALGLGYTKLLQDSLTTKTGADAFHKMEDVPSVLRIMGKKRPLGRYLRRKLLERMVPDVSMQEFKDELSFKRTKLKADERLVRSVQKGVTVADIKKEDSESDKQKALIIETNYKIYNSTGKI